jgi:hypothetical protein
LRRADTVQETTTTSRSIRKTTGDFVKITARPHSVNYPKSARNVFGWFSWINPIGIAYAQIKIGGYSESDIRGIVIVSIFVCVGLFLFLSTGALLFSTNAKVVAFAMDSVKHLLGFFIGVAMSFMGVR